MGQSILRASDQAISVVESFLRGARHDFNQLYLVANKYRTELRQLRYHRSPYDEYNTLPDVRRHIRDLEDLLQQGCEPTNLWLRTLLRCLGTQRHDYRQLLDLLNENSTQAEERAARWIRQSLFALRTLLAIAATEKGAVSSVRQAILDMRMVIGFRIHDGEQAPGRSRAVGPKINVLKGKDIGASREQMELLMLQAVRAYLASGTTCPLPLQTQSHLCPEPLRVGNFLVCSNPTFVVGYGMGHTAEWPI